MIPRIVCCCVALVASVSNAVSQKLQPVVQWGKEFEAPRRSSVSDIVGYDRNGIYAIKERYSGFGVRHYTLEQFDNEFKPAKAIDLDLKEDGRECFVEMVLQLRGELYLFSSFPDPRVKENTLSVQHIDKTTLKPENTKHKIATINFDNGSKWNNGDFKIRVSRDSSKILIYYAMPYEKNEPESFGFYVLDDTMKPLWNKEVKLPFENELFDAESFRIDNSGNVYMLGLIYKDKRKSKRRGLPNYQYTVFTYLADGKSTAEFPIRVEDRFLTDMQIEILNNKNLICAGFYSDKGKYAIRGTYFLTIDPTTKEIITRSFKEFDIDFITANMTEREAERTRKKDEKGEDSELYEYDLDKLLVGRDGSAVLIGEQYYVNVVTTTRYVNGIPQYSSTTHYYYNDIIAVKVNAAGQIEWAEKIPKRQHTIEDGGFYSSYALAVVKGRICFIFNDNAKNVGYTNVGKVFNFNAGRGESLVMLVSLTEDGKQERQPLFSSADVEVITRPKVCEQVKSNEIIIFGQRRKTQQFGKVKF